LEDVGDVLDNAQRYVKGDVGIDAILALKDDLRSLAKYPVFRSVTLAFVSQPTKGGPPQELLSLVAADLKTNKSLSSFADDLYGFATRNQHFLPGQILAIQKLTAQVQAETDVEKRIALYDKAITIADTATGFFPNTPDPAMLLASACRECAQLHYVGAKTQKDEDAANELSKANDLSQRALTAAQKWRERTPNDPAPADAMMALIQWDLGNSSQAIALLQPHLSETKSPQFGAIVSLYGVIQVRAGHPELASAAMQPLLAQSEEGRRQWIQFATQNLSTGEEAAWLDRASVAIAPDSEAQQIFLGEAWNDLFTRTGEQACLDKAGAVIAPLAAKPDPSPTVLFAMGTNEEMANHLEAAEGWYSKLLAAAEAGHLQKSDLIYRLAQNNLAMVLAKRGKDLDKAQQMATEAVMAVPGASSFHDTLAYVQARRGAYKEALVESQTAISLQPMEPSLRINRMQILLDDKQLSELSSKLKELDGLKLDLNRLSLEKKRQLEALRGATKSGQA
jgi:tetratricopeptide (TPR) repeat protein